MEDQDDERILRVAAGDREAFRELIDRHLARVVAFAARTLGDRAAAEDVAQEVFLRLWTGAARWRPGAGGLRAWLHRVALNLCLDRLARRREAGLDEAPDPPDPRPAADTLLHRRDVGRRVQEALAALPPQQRAALALCHFEGMRNAEAAQVLEVSVEALESLLARGRRTLRERLRGLAPELLGDA